MDLKYLDNIKINFVVGTGRSGTTLLVALLQNFPNCISTPEIHHFIYFYKKYKHIDKVSTELIDDYKAYLTEFFKYKKNPLIGPLNLELIDSLKIGQAINYSQFTKLIYLSLYGNKGFSNDVGLIVDKNPYYTYHIDKIKSVFPDAKILALIRDYRAYALSNIQSQKPWIPIKSPFYYATVWNLFLRKIDLAKHKYGASIMVVKYEDIALNKEVVVKNIIDFFGLPYSESIFDFHISMKQKIKELNSSPNTDRMIKKITDLSTPINTDRVMAWKKSLPLSVMKKIEFVSSKIGISHGYVPKNRLSIKEKIIYYMQQFPFKLRVKIFELLNSPKIYFYLMYRNRLKSVEAELKGIN